MLRGDKEGCGENVLFCFILKTSSCDKMFEDRRQAKHVGHRTENQIFTARPASLGEPPLVNRKVHQETAHFVESSVAVMDITSCRLSARGLGRKSGRCLCISSVRNVVGIGLPTMANLEGADLGHGLLLHRSVYQVTGGRASISRSVLAGHENMSVLHFVQTVSEGSGALFIRI